MSDKDETKDFSDLPDISGVFQVDEKDIPKEIISPVALNGSFEKREPIMLYDEKKEKAEQKKARKREKERRQEKKAKQAKKARLILFAVLAFVVALGAMVFGIKTAVDNSKKPQVELEKAKTGDLILHYDTNAVLKNQINGQGDMGTYALFIENDYDIYGLTTGLYTEVLLENGTSATGVVSQIRQIAPDEALFGEIVLALPQEEYSASVNFLVTVELYAQLNMTKTETAQLAVQTKKAENAVLVPETAVYRDGLNYYVFTVSSKKLVRLPVSVGITQDGLTEITQGLTEGTDVVVQSQLPFEEMGTGVKIRIKQEKESGSGNETD